jgi:hypothetical protein
VVTAAVLIAADSDAGRIVCRFARQG